MVESKLVEGLKKGDPAAYEELYNRFAPQIYSLLKKYVPISDIEDAMQDVFVRIYKGIHGFRGDSKLSTWIYRIVVNVGKDFAKKARENLVETVDISTTDVDENALSAIESDANILEDVLSELDWELIMKIMEQLSEEDKKLIKYRDVDKLSYDEIAKIMKKPVGTIKSKIHYARKRLQKLLEEAGFR